MMRILALLSSLSSLTFTACTAEAPATPRPSSPLEAVNAAAGGESPPTWELAFWLRWQTSSGAGGVTADPLVYPLHVGPGERLERIDLDITQDFTDGRIAAAVWATTASGMSPVGPVSSTISPDVAGPATWIIELDAPIDLIEGEAVSIALVGDGHEGAGRGVGVVTAWSR